MKKVAWRNRDLSAVDLARPWRRFVRLRASGRSQLAGAWQSYPEGCPHTAGAGRDS